MNREGNSLSRAAFKAWLLVVSICALVPTIALVVTCVAGDGGQPHQSFFSTCGQVGPVFGLAVFVEIAVVMAPVVAMLGATDAVRATTRTLVRTNAAMLLISESVALYAIATERSSLFLALCVVLPWLVQLVLIVDTAYYRVGLHRIGRA